MISLVLLLDCQRDLEIVLMDDIPGSSAGLSEGSGDGAHG